jgi:predicted nucleic-acid-binding Zn-ribbon protein
MITSRECPSCGSPEFAEGKLGVHSQTFIPRRTFVFFGYVIRGAVCLGCGYVHHYIDEAGLAKLRQKVRDSAADLR